LRKRIEETEKTNRRHFKFDAIRDCGPATKERSSTYIKSGGETGGRLWANRRGLGQNTAGAGIQGVNQEASTKEKASANEKKKKSQKTTHEGNAELKGTRGGKGRELLMAKKPPAKGATGSRLGWAIERLHKHSDKLKHEKRTFRKENAERGREKRRAGESSESIAGGWRHEYSPEKKKGEGLAGGLARTFFKEAAHFKTDVLGLKKKEKPNQEKIHRT